MGLVAGSHYGSAFVCHCKLAAGLPKDGRSMGTVDQSPRVWGRRLVGYPAFGGLPNWQSSCRDGLLELNVPKVPGS